MKTNATLEILFRISFWIAVSTSVWKSYPFFFLNGIPASRTYVYNTCTRHKPEFAYRFGSSASGGGGGVKNNWRAWRACVTEIWIHRRRCRSIEADLMIYVKERWVRACVCVYVFVRTCVCVSVCTMFTVGIETMKTPPADPSASFGWPCLTAFITGF